MPRPYDVQHHYGFTNPSEFSCSSLSRQSSRTLDPALQVDLDAESAPQYPSGTAEAIFFEHLAALADDHALYGSLRSQ